MMPGPDAIGQKTMTSKKLTRTYVQRVLMGPEQMFSKELVGDESVGGEPQKLSVWSVFVQTGNQLNTSHFLERLGLQEQDVVVGKISETLPTDLVSAKPWAEPGLLTLDRDVEAGVLKVNHWWKTEGIWCELLPDWTRVSSIVKRIPSALAPRCGLS